MSRAKDLWGISMDKFSLQNFKGGWVIGNFSPSIFQHTYFEAGIKYFSQGDKEPSHAQKLATEVTIIHEGCVRIGDVILNSGEILVIYPGEFADFEAIAAGSLTCIKFPSIPSDKILK